ncbi:thiamine ABC transporter substrate binding subunit [Nocardioides sp.]|uniref:thiamine ABC transporter substrate-binding protein n=1 Tax=Nocardioides sp. TaxID=35761 RepID=UPI0035639876
MSTRRAGAAAFVLAVTTTGCSAIGESVQDDGPASDRVVVVTHDSFSLPKKLLRQFETESGFEVVVRKAGDAGALTNKLVLTADDPIGDVAFGVDNTFASRALDAGVFAAYEHDLPAGAGDHSLPGDDDQRLTPVDNGNVCINVDDTWFDERELAPPTTLADLADPAYRDLLVLPGAATSSPGMAFLLATVAEYGDDWPRYWADLMENGAKLTAGWSDAYFVDFTAGGGEGDRPIVLSYDSSPAFTVPEGADASTTSALLETCFEQVEYAGVLDGAENVDGAEAFIDFLTGAEVQASLPESMYVFPVRDDVDLPAEWAAYAVQPDEAYAVDPSEIAANRDDWLREWSDVTSR